MALLQNKRITYQTPGFFFGGATICDTNSFHKNYRGRFIGETFDKKASMPLGTEGSYAYVLAQKGGGLATYTDISGVGTISSSQSNGINIEGALGGTSSLTSSANLITSMLASLIGSGTLSTSMVGTVQLASELIGSGNISGGLKMFAGLVASLDGSGSINGILKGFSNMESNIYVNQSETTVKQLVDGVWNAIASEYNNVGTMGEATQIGGGGGGATAAQIWNYSDRTLTESIGGGATVADIWGAQISDHDDTPGSFANKISTYGGVSHVIDRSSFDEQSKKELEDLRNSFKKTAENIQKSIANIKPQIVSEGKTTVVKYNDAQQNFIQEFITETIPELADKIDNLIPLLKTYEELILDFEQKEKDYEKLIEELINNK